jgi:GAF domain-containing protein
MDSHRDKDLVGNPLTPLLDVAAALVSSLELEEALANVAARIGEAMSVSKVDIYAYDRERDVLVYEARWVTDTLPDVSINPIGSEVRIAERPTWRPIIDGKVVEWHETDADLPAEERPIYEVSRQKSTLDAPLRIGSEIIGVLGVVQRDYVRRFTPLEKALFAEFCSIAAIGIRNAKAFRHEQEQSRHLTSLLEACTIVAGGKDDDGGDTVFAALAQTAAVGIDVALTTIYEYDVAGDALICRASHARQSMVTPIDSVGDSIPLDSRPRERDLLAGKATMLVDHANDETLPAEQSDTMSRAGEAVCISIPLRFAEQTRGILRLCEADATRTFTIADLQLAEAIGTQAAIALAQTGPAPA